MNSMPASTEILQTSAVESSHIIEPIANPHSSFGRTHLSAHDAARRGDGNCDNSHSKMFMPMYTYRGLLKWQNRQAVGQDDYLCFGHQAFESQQRELVLLFTNAPLKRFVFPRMTKWVGRSQSASEQDVIELHRGLFESYKPSNEDDYCRLDVPKSIMCAIERELAPVLQADDIKIITVAGYGHNAGIATIAALGIAERTAEIEASIRPKVQVVTFASPLTGNRAFWQRLEALNMSYHNYFIDQRTVRFRLWQPKGLIQPEKGQIKLNRTCENGQKVNLQ